MQILTWGRREKLRHSPLLCCCCQFYHTHPAGLWGETGSLLVSRHMHVQKSRNRLSYRGVGGWHLANVCCIMLHKQTQHLRESHVLCVCPFDRRWCVKHVAGCLVASPTPLEQQKKEIESLQSATQWRVLYCICRLRACFLTLNVYLLHLVDLCDGFPELLRKLPELLSARRAETHQLLLLGGKRAHHGDAVSVICSGDQRRQESVFTMLLQFVEF